MREKGGEVKSRSGEALLVRRVAIGPPQLAVAVDEEVGDPHDVALDPSGDGSDLLHDPSTIALERRVPAKGELPIAFSVDVDGREFEITLDHRGSGRGRSYRGPTGYLLITATPLASRRWSMHQVDVSKSGRIASRIRRMSPPVDRSITVSAPYLME